MSTVDITVMQTADAFTYRRLLSLTSVCNRSYCARLDLRYEAYIGIKRGFHSWHACFNRIFMLRELLDRGFAGWVIYLDADAYVYDHGFDVRAYVQRHESKAYVFGPGGLESPGWDVNSGVFLINLGAPAARRLVELWHADVLSTSEDVLRRASRWEDVPNDQARLHGILAAHPELLAAALVEPREFLNDYRASFIRQVLRGEPEISMQGRCDHVLADTADVFSRYPPHNAALLEEWMAERGGHGDRDVVAALLPQVQLRAERAAAEAAHLRAVNRGLRDGVNLLLASYGHVSGLFRRTRMRNRLIALLMRDQPALHENDDLVHALYRGILGREPDFEGGARLRASLSADLPLHQAIEDMIDSEEFRQRYSSRVLS
jgi:hypothetical protein